MSKPHKYNNQHDISHYVWIDCLIFQKFLLQILNLLFATKKYGCSSISFCTSNKVAGNIGSPIVCRALHMHCRPRHNSAKNVLAGLQLGFYWHSRQACRGNLKKIMVYFYQKLDRKAIS